MRFSNTSYPNTCHQFENSLDQTVTRKKRGRSSVTWVIKTVRMMMQSPLTIWPRLTMTLLAHRERYWYHEQNKLTFYIQIDQNMCALVLFSENLLKDGTIIWALPINKAPEFDRYICLVKQTNMINGLGLSCSPRNQELILITENLSILESWIFFGHNDPKSCGLVSTVYKRPRIFENTVANWTPG